MIPNKHGFITAEKTIDGERIGFELVSSSGNTATLASIDSESDTRVSKYGVNTGQLDSFLAELGTPNKDAMLYIDEIGQMELFSDDFKKLTVAYLAMPNPFIGTLTSVYSDAFTDALRARADIEIIHMTLENRDDVTANIQARIAQYYH
jgi:nucleoside-triphosphatase